MTPAASRDVSRVTRMAGQRGEPDDLCADGEHDIHLPRAAGFRECRNCGRSLQAIVDWWGHTVAPNRL